MRIARVLTTLLAIATVLVPAPAAVAAPLTDEVELRPVVGGLSTPVDLAAPPGDDRLFVAEKIGRIRIIKNGTLLATPFLDITGPVNASAGERGLLGIAFDPDYESNGRFYVSYTADAGSGDSVVARYEVSANDPDRADAGSGVTLLTLDQPYSNHNGGQVAIGPDGYLYASFGDGGGGGDPSGNGQNTGNLLGTIVRVDPETGDPAPGNPFIGSSGADEIWAYGLRNPWRFAFDPVDGSMYIGDVGENAYEEINRIPAGAEGLNFGWNIREGAHCRVSGCSSQGLTDPILEYAHGSDPCSGSVTGGYVYRGRDIPRLRGHYFYADFCKGKLRSFRWTPTGVKEKTDWTSPLSAPSRITSFGVDGFGELYALAGGTVWRFESTRTEACDFNADGRSDLPVGTPGEGHSGAAEAGMLYVFRGRSVGLDPQTAGRRWQGRNGLAQTPENGDHFGEALACGDFNGDGYGDLAVGVPGENLLGEVDVGVVHVIYGSAVGLTNDDDQVWHQDKPGVDNLTENGDEFGAALASGDFDRDGFDDLAIGIPGEAIGPRDDAGGVAVLYGSGGGLSSSGDDWLHQDAPGVKGTAEAGDRFGAALAAGDFNGDGADDLAVGVPGETLSGVKAGFVQVFPGAAGGLTKQDDTWHRGKPGVAGDLLAGDQFGASLASGHFDLDGLEDLAAGGVAGSGSVTVFTGTGSGIDGTSILLVQGQAGTPGVAEAGDRFGEALASGDFDGDRFDDLAVGAPGESRSGLSGMGQVTVLNGGVAGVASSGASQWYPAKPGFDGSATNQQGFGLGIVSLDLNGDGFDDLIVGSAATTVSQRGAIHYLPGTGGGLSVNGDVAVDQATAGVPGGPEQGDRFGWALPQR